MCELGKEVGWDGEVHIGDDGIVVEGGFLVVDGGSAREVASVVLSVIDHADGEVNSWTLFGSRKKRLLVLCQFAVGMVGD